MIKVIGDNAWQGDLWDEENPRVALVKYASNGISGLDKQAFVKRASEETSEELLKKVAQMEVKPGEELVHLIAMGTTEAYGPNRNGDGFSKQACIKYHPTFVKHARFYRNHKNKDPEKSYGIVKASAYNPVMSRIELIVALNGNEKAAKANGGLVADKEMEKLASGDDIAVSMACASDPEYPVLVKDRGYIGISWIRPDMEVMTRDGSYHKVTSINRRKFTGTLYTFEWEDCAKPFEVTSDHQLLILSSAGEWVWVAAEKIREGDFLKHYAGDDFDGQRKITRITTREVIDIQTYNIEVEDEPSYIAGGIVSHNCSVPFDVCSCCGNKATTREEYCKGIDEGGKCEAGGLSSNICKFASVNGKIKQLYADNTQPDFFDISNVFIPADRIAYSSGLLKHASYSTNGYKPTMYEKESAYTIDYDPDVPYALTVLQDTILDFRAMEEEGLKKMASTVGWQDARPLYNTQVPDNYLPGNTYKVLADMSICLPASQFIQLTQHCPFEKAAQVGQVVAPLSNSAMLYLTKNDTRRNPYKPSEGAPDSLYSWVCSQDLTPVRPDAWLKQAAYNYIDPTPVKLLSKRKLTKMAEDEWIKEAAYQYALYKVAFLQSQPEEDIPLMAELITARDYVPCVN